MVNLLGLEEDATAQGDLFDADEGREKKQALMGCFDEVNGRYGRDALRMGATTLASRGWNMRRRFLSPAYTTDLSGIPEVH